MIRGITPVWKFRHTVSEITDSENGFGFFQDHLSTSARTMKTTTSKHNLKEKLKVANQYLQKLKSLSHEVDACTYYL